MEQNPSCLRLYSNETVFRLYCYDNDPYELYLFGYDRNSGRGRVSIVCHSKIFYALHPCHRIPFPDAWVFIINFKLNRNITLPTGKDHERTDSIRI